MTTHKNRMLSGEPYLASDRELVDDHARAQLLVERFNATSVTEERERQALLHDLFGAVGEDVVVKPPLQLDYGYPVTVGARTFVNYGAVLLDCAPIAIGADVQIATNVQLLTAIHPIDAEERKSGWESAAPIAVGDGAWLGGGVIVCPGVSIGKNTVVGAGSVVTKDLPPGVVAVGNPCRVIREV